jgi:hypothetical protein
MSTEMDNDRKVEEKKIKWNKEKWGIKVGVKERRGLPRNEAKIVFITLPMSTYSCFHRRHDILLQSDP